MNAVEKDGFLRARTRVKICGLTRIEDVAAAVDAGADAIGLVFYSGSPRYVANEVAAMLAGVVPPLVSVVGLFVNASHEEVTEVLASVPLTLLQFHGDETPAECAHFGRPYLRAVGVRKGLDLLEFASRHHAAEALLLDAVVDGHGGGGRVFDWSLIPEKVGHQAVLSGGLNAQNVAEAIFRVRPYAVDVSTGVESAKGIKDAQKIRAFVAAVRSADATLERLNSNDPQR